MNMRWKIACQKCGQVVNRVDGEYERHYVVANVLCTTAKREIPKVLEEAPEAPQR